MKVYLINLDSETERLAAADAQLKRLGVEYERFPAVRGSALTKGERDVAVNGFRWWCAVGRAESVRLDVHCLTMVFIGECLSDRLAYLKMM